MTKKQNNNLIWIIVAVAGLFIIISQGQPGTFSVLYQGQEVQGYVTNQSGECWTMGADNCVRQTVRLINLTEQGILICPEGYFPTRKQCSENFGLMAVQQEPEKHMCYRINEDEGICEEAGEKESCSQDEFNSLSSCQTKLAEEKSGLLEFISQPYTIVIGILALIVIIGLIVDRL